MRAGDKSSVVEFEVDRFETKSEWHVISKSMGAAWQSRGETTLQGICDSNPPRKLLWEHESQIRLCRLASLSYSSPYIYIYIWNESLRISFYCVQRNTLSPSPPFVESENPSSKMRAENFKGSLRITRDSCIHIYVYFGSILFPSWNFFPRWQQRLFI